MIGLALLLERLFFKRAPLDALYVLGYKRLNLPSFVVAGCITLVALGFFPIFTLVTGAAVTLKSNWWWILIGAIALNGIAEETLFRGYVFGGLRRAGLSFARAGFISLLVFAAVHLLLFIQNPFIIALLGTLVAITSAYPMAYLFEKGNNTLWGPVLLHVSTHAIRLVDIAEPYYMTALVAWMALQIGAPFLVFAFRGYLRSRSQVGLDAP
jgi:membrane protease YdiL (CAAX protease family)